MRQTIDLAARQGKRFETNFRVAAETTDRVIPTKRGERSRQHDRRVARAFTQLLGRRRSRRSELEVAILHLTILTRLGLPPASYYGRFSEVRDLASRRTARLSRASELAFALDRPRAW